MNTLQISNRIQKFFVLVNEEGFYFDVGTYCWDQNSFFTVFRSITAAEGFQKSFGGEIVQLKRVLSS